MFQYACSILVVYLIESSSAFVGQNNFGGGGFQRGGGGGGGSIFDSFLNAFSAPTAAPFMDPFSNSFGRSNPNMLTMMADIDYADQLSARSDTLAAKREERQGMNEARQGQETTTASPRAPGENARQLANLNSKTGETPYPEQGSQQPSSFYSQRMSQRRNPDLMSPSHVSAGDATHPAVWTFSQNNREKQPNRTQLLPHQERNRLRLQHVLRPSGNSQLKDVARQALSRNDVPKATQNVPPRRFRPSSFRDRTPPRRNVDPDLMSDMLDMAGDLGMAGMLMGQMMPQNQMYPPTRGRGRCNLNSSQVLLEFIMTGRMCGSSMGGGFGR